MLDDRIYKDENCAINFSKFTDIIEYLDSEDNIFIISDIKLKPLYPDLYSKINPYFIEASESNKSFEEYTTIISQLISAKADKDLLIIGLGGGIVCDLAGFVSSTYKRGTRLTLIPTTLLSMADAAIGGKNAVNFDNIKNIIGSFKIPENILICTEFVNSLSDDEFQNGIAEILKISIVYSSQLFNIIENLSFQDIRRNNLILKEIVGLSVISKMEIVNADFYDKELRRILNFGHTVGHAIEANYGLSHGKSVAIGMLVSLKMSLQFQLISDEIYDRIINVFQNYTFDLNFSFDSNKLMKFIEHDKKVFANLVKEIVINDIGKYEFRDIPTNNYRELLNDMC